MQLLRTNGPFDTPHKSQRSEYKCIRKSYNASCCRIISSNHHSCYSSTPQHPLLLTLHFLFLNSQSYPTFAKLQEPKRTQINLKYLHIQHTKMSVRPAYQTVARNLNGVGNFVLQCKKVTFRYCNWGGSSDGMR